MASDDFLPTDLAAFYLTTPWVLSLLLVANGLAFLVGVRYYLPTMAGIETFLWPLYGDSPTALALGALVLASALPFVQSRRDLDSVPGEWADSEPNGGTADRTAATGLLARRVPGPLVVLTTFAVVWLVETGVWTVVALNVPLVRPDLPLDLYVGFGPDSLWAYWGIMATHAAFLLEAGLIAHVGRTSRRALAAALVAAIANDLFDYGFLVGLPTAGHPPIRYDPGWVLAAASVATSLLGVAVAAWLLADSE